MKQAPKCLVSLSIDKIFALVCYDYFTLKLVDKRRVHIIFAKATEKVCHPHKNAIVVVVNYYLS